MNGTSWCVALSLAVAAPLSAQCTSGWLPGDPVPGVYSDTSGGGVEAMTWWDPDGVGPLPPQLVIAGGFTVAGAAVARGVAAYDPPTGGWSSFGAGLDGQVRALTVSASGQLVAGGSFYNSTSGPSYLAQWNGAAWIGFPLGPMGSVDALATMPNGDLIIAGSFASVGGVPAVGIARWNGTSWSALGAGTGMGQVDSLCALPNGDLLVGGSFAFAGGVAANGIARWNGSSWSALGTGVSGGLQPRVEAIALLPGGDIVIGGLFDLAGGVIASSLARWNGSAWSAVGGGVTGEVKDLMVTTNGSLFVGGFGWVNSNPAITQLASWNGSTWSALGASPGIWVRCLAELPNQDLVAAGSAQNLGPGAIMRWNGAAWSSLSTGMNATARTVLRLANGDALIGGDFTTAGGTAANYIAQTGGAIWSPLGAGMSGFGTATVLALCQLPNGDVVAGGLFGNAGGAGANNVARWNGASWSALGTGIASALGVRALLPLPNGQVIAGGQFTTAGSVAANNIAVWNGASWSTFGAGLSGTGAVVNALARTGNGDLIVAGQFSFAGGVAASNIAKWDGSGWTALGAGVAGEVNAVLELPSGELLAAGSFSAGVMQQWNGAAWAPIATGYYGTAQSVLRLQNGEFLVGGRFHLGGAIGLHYLARWDGSVWTPYVPATSLGVNGIVRSMALFPNGDVVAVGDFTTAGQYVSAFTARLRPSCPATAVPYGSGCSGAGGPDTLTAQSLPWCGSTFTAVASGFPNNSLLVGVRGLSSAALPLASVVSQGLPGCSLLVTPDLLDVYVPMGTTQVLTLPIPSSSSIAGMTLHQQAVVIELAVGGGITAWTSSNALSLTLGTW